MVTTNPAWAILYGAELIPGNLIIKAANDMKPKTLTGSGLTKSQYENMILE